MTLTPLSIGTRTVRAVTNSAPVWIPITLCTHLIVQGLLPALKEEQRLEFEGAALEARHAELTAERYELDRILEAHRDPVFLERERRALLDPALRRAAGSSR